MTNVLWIDMAKGIVKVAESRRVAQAIGNSGIIIQDSGELAMSIVQTSMLVEIYNQHSEKKVKRFKDRATAAKRVWDLLSKSEPVTIGSTQDTSEFDATEPTDKKPKDKPETAANGQKQKTKRSGSQKDKRLYPTPGHAPYRKGTKNGNTWDMIVENPGKTFAEYLEMGGRPQLLSHAIRNGYVKTE